MNIEELRKLKNELEKTKHAKTYVTLDGISKFDIEYSLDCKVLLSEIVFSHENTDEFIKDIENYIKNTITYLSINNIPYDQIRLYSYFGIYCKEEFAKILYENLSNENKYNELIKDLPNQISTIYVPLNFGVDLTGTGTENMQVDDYIYENLHEDVFTNYDLEDNTVYGVVNFDQFISKMADLGYSVEFNNKECKSIDDYINEFINAKNENIHMYITADFGRKKTIQKSKGTKK